ncbi:hypothetical protein [Butyrivibrio sp. WCD2001]|uniref:hypothetical protein n=1 Tax=Butyrivibrio sp. WCD2001 TaxID=1280681 RepID=UPI000421F6A0|nr:hypothetical protein [Butyrivibrio sp. WCD2001]
MDRFGLTNKKVLAILCGIAVAAFVFDIYKPLYPYVDHISSILYSMLFIAWGLMVRRRILNGAIKKRLLYVCGFMVVLFVLRVSRFNFFDDCPIISTYIWYAYYIPMTAIPLLGMMAALYTEPVRSIKRVRIAERILIVAEVMLVIFVMTNSFHKQVFSFYGEEPIEYSRKWGYVLVFAWMAVLGIGSLVVFMKRCSISSARKSWYIPAIWLVIGMSLLVIYIVVGGSPVLFGQKIYHLQEAFCFPFITIFESGIQIGFIPANTGYELLFDYSGINAAICDADGRAILTSKNWNPNEKDKDHRIKKEFISGGYINWVVDMSSINRLNEEISEVTEELEEENDLIRQENEVRAQRVRFETKNRLYNSIANAVRPQAARVYELLEKDESGTVSRANLIYATFLSAFIKRMGNLMLISDENPTVSTAELCLAIRESMDYMGLKGISCELMEYMVEDMPSSFIIFTYDLFEKLMEDAWDSIHSCMVRLEKNERFEITIIFDSPVCTITQDWKKSELTEFGSRLSIRNEDDTFYVTVSKEVEA